MHAAVGEIGVAGDAEIFSPLSRVSVHTVPRSPARCTIRCGTPRSGITVPGWNGAAFGRRPRRAAIQPPCIFANSRASAMCRAAAW